MRACVGCGVDISGRRRDARTCGARRCHKATNRVRCSTLGCQKPNRARGLCSTHYNNAHQPGRHKVAATCERCGCPYGAQRPRQRFCSIACRDGYVAVVPEARRLYDREHRRRRRAALRTGDVEWFDGREIYERDEWVCQICHEPVDPAAMWPDPRCASLDHIIPVSRPGTSHTRANVRLAHLDCNIARGNRMDEVTING